MDLKEKQSLEKNICGIENLYYSYQPIVNIHTGVTLGFEALLRGWGKAGYNSISEVFDTAWADGNLLHFDKCLRNAAVRKLSQRKDLSSLKLFYNIDNRLFQETDFISGVHGRIDSAEVYTSRICLEISEKHEFTSYQANHSVLQKYKNQHYRIAIDDFGSGYSGLTLLYHSDPDFIKIDRFFIEKINDDSRKKFFVANVVNLAHMMGISVIAEGIETVEEFYVCREIGCDYAQGFLIQKAEGNIDDLLRIYPVIEELIEKQSRKSKGDRGFIMREMKRIDPLPFDTSTEQILELFRNKQSIQSFPVINEAGEPMGLLRESDLKKYVYSPYGISILQHKSSTEGVESLISRAPVMEISNPIEKILDLYSLNEDLENVIITENGHYLGILGASAILRILSEKKISIAQDQNPLTKLPGNTSINSYLAQTMKTENPNHIIVYFDLDNFKPFNDVYGFRQGDRIIILFSDILQEQTQISKEFIGHIGGDDFFVGYNKKEHSNKEILDEIQSIIKHFEVDVIPFYKEKDINNGYITAKSRSGRNANFPLMTVSAAVVCLGGLRTDLTMETLVEKIALYKEKAKKSPNHLAVLDFDHDN